MRIVPKGIAPALAVSCALMAAAGSADAQSVTYESSVRKIVAARCMMCHGKGAPTLEEFKKDEDGWKKKMKGPRLESYADVMVLVNGSDAGAMMRRLDDGKSAKDGKPGNMYNYLGKDDAERKQNLAVFKSWVGDWNLKRRKELTDAELQKITAREK